MDKRRYAIVAVFAIAAVLTPPDVISQIGLAIPIIILYEISIIGARMIEKKRAKNAAEEDLDDEEASAELIPCPNCGCDIYEDVDQCPLCGEFIIHSASPWWVGRGTGYTLLVLLGILATIVALLIH